MEQQTISVAKGGFITTLSSRASILAAANPINGSFSKEKSLLEEVRFADAMLSRFDLVFQLRDIR